MPPTITPDHVRLIQLHTLGMLTPPEHAAGKADVLAAVRRMGALQIDTINVIARSPYMVLWSRLGQYDPRWLDELLAEGALFEYWSHAACFLPIEDYPLYRRFMLDRRLVRRWEEWYVERQAEINAVLEHARANGAVRSADFERKDGKKGTWWDWKVEKEALEYWHTMGELMIRERKNFQRIYDLRERVLPGAGDLAAPERDEVYLEQTLRTVKILGVATARWVPDYFRLPKIDNQQRLDALVKSGEILPVEIEGWNEPGYVHTDNLLLLEAALRGELIASATSLLSPFDPLIWDRARMKALYNFDYTIEVYLPQAKRKYGYYVLPVLHRGRMSARVDLKAHRAEGKFEVRSLYLEAGVEFDEQFQADLLPVLQACADWHGTPELVLGPVKTAVE